jgi:hypothetical protein
MWKNISFCLRNFGRFWTSHILSEKGYSCQKWRRTELSLITRENGTVDTTIILKETKYTLLYQYLFVLAVSGNATCFDSFLGSSSGLQEY